MESTASTIVSSIAGFAVCLGITWGLLIYGGLPNDIAAPNYVAVLYNAQYSWVAKIWYLIHYILLDVQLSLSLIQLITLSILPWLICGVTVGLLSRKASRGFVFGVIAVIISVIIGWLIVFLSSAVAIELPGVGTIASRDPIQYVLSLLSFPMLVVGIVSGLGGALGGVLSPRRQ